MPTITAAINEAHGIRDRQMQYIFQQEEQHAKSKKHLSMLLYDFIKMVGFKTILVFAKIIFSF